MRPVRSRVSSIEKLFDSLLSYVVCFAYCAIVSEREDWTKRMVVTFQPVQVKAWPNYKLWIKYADGVEGQIDLSDLVGKGVFALWEDKEAFGQVYIGSDGQIAWSDEIDICPDAAYMTITGKTPEELFPNLMTEATYA